MHDVLASLVRIAALVWKELVTMFRDPGSRKILIVPVLAQAVLFGYGATFNLEHVPWTYCDESRSALSHEVIRKVGENGVFELVRPSLNLDALGEAVERGEALTALYFPDDFAETGRLLVTSASIYPRSVIPNSFSFSASATAATSFRAERRPFLSNILT